MNEKMLNRVRGLLAKAESTEAQFPEEAASLREAAERLILTYGIERAMADPARQEREQITTIEIRFDDPYSTRKSHLLFRVAKALGCDSITHHPAGNRRRHTRATVVGYPSDLEQVELLYTSLLLQSTRDLGKVSGLRDTRAQRSAYLLGFADRAGERLEALYAKVVEESTTPGTALVLADRRSLVEAECQKMFPTAKSYRQSPINLDGYYTGRKAANSADLGQERFGGGRQRALTRQG